MVMFIAFVVAIVSASLVGYLLGNGRAIRHNSSADGSDAAAVEYLEDIKRQSEDAVRTGSEAGQSIQEIVADIRRRSDRADDDPDNKGGN